MEACQVSEAWGQLARENRLSLLGGGRGSGLDTQAPEPSVAGGRPDWGE